MNIPFAKKHLGQNFLIDRAIKERIVDAAGLLSDDTVLEIGPGPGALTAIIAPKVKKLIAVEKDGRFAAALTEKFRGQPQVEIRHADFLKFDLTALPAGTKVIGNLPYNISTPIIEKFLTRTHACPELFFTVQLEFGQRLAAAPGSKDYGSLTCFVQYHCDVDLLFKIPAQAFRPAPKVTSCFLKISFRPSQTPSADPDLLFKIIRSAFQQRRKKISNSLQAGVGKDHVGEILSRLHLAEDLRAEDLSLADYVAITREVLRRQEKSSHPGIKIPSPETSALPDHPV